MDPSPLDLYGLRPFQDRVYEELVDGGCLTEDQLQGVLTQKKVWGPTDDKVVEDLLGNLKKFQSELRSLEFKSNSKKVVQSYIDHTKGLLEDMNRKKTYLTSITAEYIAKIQVYKEMLFTHAYELDGTRAFPDRASFDALDNKFLEYLLSGSYFNSEVGETQIRKIARSDPWRSMWIAANKVGDLFGKPTTQLTDLQRSLVTWSVVYDNVHESMETPSAEVIDNDQLLDEWFEQQHAKRNAERPNNSHINAGGGNIEVGIVAETQEDAERVYKLNGPQGIAIAKARERVIKERGAVQEKDLPDVRQNILMRMNAEGQEAVKNRLKS